MKRTKMLILIIAGLAALAGCDSVTGDIIDDYNRAKHPVAAFSSVPGTLVTLDRLEGWGNRIDLYVNSKRITEYRYCINAEKWSGKYDVDDPITLSEPECGLYTVRIVGSINGRHWQSKEHPTEYTFRIVPGRAALKGLTLKDAATQTPLALTPQFEPHIGEYALQAGPELRRVLAGYSEYYPGECSVTCTTAEGAGQAVAVTGGWEIDLADGENIITVASEITGVSDMSYTITINRTARTWSEPEAISSGGNGLSLSRFPSNAFGTDSTGTIGFAWEESVDDKSVVLINTLEDGNWTGEQVIATSDGRYANCCKLQYDLHDNTCVLWIDSLTEETQINEYAIKRTTFNKELNTNETKELQRFSGTMLYNFDYQMNGAGDIFTTYSIRTTSNDSSYRTYASVTTNELEFEYINLSGTSNKNKVFSVDCNQTGNAIYTYWEYSDGKCSVYARYYDVENGWQNPTLLQSDTGACTPVAKIDSNGNAIVVWGKYNGSTSNIDFYASNYSEMYGWSQPRKMNNLTETTGNDHIDVAYDSLGNAIAVWQQSNGGNNINIWANRYNTDTDSWEGVKLLASEANIKFRYPKIVFDQYNDAIVVWNTYYESLYGVSACKYQADKGWTTAQVISAPCNESITNTNLTTSNDGGAIVIWIQRIEGLQYIYSSAYR